MWYAFNSHDFAHFLSPIGQYYMVLVINSVVTTSIGHPKVSTLLVLLQPQRNSKKNFFTNDIHGASSQWYLSSFALAKMMSFSAKNLMSVKHKLNDTVANWQIFAESCIDLKGENFKKSWTCWLTLVNFTFSSKTVYVVILDGVESYPFTRWRCQHFQKTQSVIFSISLS